MKAGGRRLKSHKRWMLGELGEFWKTLEQIWSMKEEWKRDIVFLRIVVGYNIDLLNVS